VRDMAGGDEDLDNEVGEREDVGCVHFGKSLIILWYGLEHDG
jgi:hypothetical protein